LHFVNKKKCITLLIKDVGIVYDGLTITTLRINDLDISIVFHSYALSPIDGIVVTFKGA